MIGSAGDCAVKRKAEEEADMKIKTNVRAGIITSPRCAPAPRCTGGGGGGGTGGGGTLYAY
jgi:hypothetical protein